MSSFLVFGQKDVMSLSSTLLIPALVSDHPPRSPSSIHCRRAFRHQDWSVRCAHCYWYVTTFSVEIAKKCVCIYMHKVLFPHLSVYIPILKLLVHTDISDFMSIRGFPGLLPTLFITPFFKNWFLLSTRYLLICSNVECTCPRKWAQLN